ncbi:MAG: hypothetical protein MR883_06950 [Clostridiales bacterium]|nr:hypothetical protein [Clostridiales bacterium]
MKGKRKWGDRSDAVWLKDLPPLNRIMPGIMPNRADNEAYINVEVDLAPLYAYLEKKNAGRTEDKYTFFHVVSAAIAKAFVLRPRMNRFICNHKVYQRNELTVAFVVKKHFDDKSEEGLAFLTFDDKETMDSYHQKIMNVIHTTRRDDVLDTSSGAMNIISKLPQWAINLIISTVLWLDKHGWAPQALIGTDPNHASIFLSNLGSIGLEGGYHHLVNWGTNSCFIVVGKKYWKMDYPDGGEGILHEVLPLGITLDERIGDGYYYSGTVALVKELLTHPDLLDLPADTPVEYAIKR